VLTRVALFQDRYKSIVTSDQNYVEELVRYVHLNPIRAGICPSMDSLDGYRWCGHSALMGKRSCAFQDTAQVLRRFGKDAASARKQYREFLLMKCSGPAEDERDELLTLVRQSNVEKRSRHEPMCWVIGDQDFVRSAIEKDRYRRAEIASHAAKGWNLDRLAKYIAGKVDVSTVDLKKRGRATSGSRARKLMAYIGYAKLGISQHEIAAHLHVTGSAVSQMAVSGEKIARESGMGKLII